MAKILLVEDNEMNRDMLMRRLEKAGHRVLIATNGIEAVELTEREKPDLILMDMSLPEMDGWEATRHLKGQFQTRSIPIIALTANAMQHDKERSFDAGVDDFDTKPVKFDQLQDKIDRLLAENPEIRGRYSKD